MMHLVFHVAIAALVLDPLIIWAACMIGILWTVQWIFWEHGVVRGSLARRESRGKLALRALLAAVSAVSLILAFALRKRWRSEIREEVRA